MLKYFFIFLLFTLNSITWASSDIPQKIVVLDRELHLSLQRGGEDGYIAVYEDSEHPWKLSFTIRFEPQTNTDLLVLAQNIKDASIKPEDNAPYQVTADTIILKNEDGSVVVDFVVPDGSEPSYVHNVWSFSKVPKGYVCYEISRQVYDEDNNAMEHFIKDRPILRQQMLKELSSPVVKPPFNVN